FPRGGRAAGEARARRSLLRPRLGGEGRLRPALSARQAGLGLRAGQLRGAARAAGAARLAPPVGRRGAGALALEPGAEAVRELRGPALAAAQVPDDPRARPRRRDVLGVLRGRRRRAPADALRGAARGALSEDQARVAELVAEVAGGRRVSVGGLQQRAR